MTCSTAYLKSLRYPSESLLEIDATFVRCLSVSPERLTSWSRYLNKISSIHFTESQMQSPGQGPALPTSNSHISYTRRPPFAKRSCVLSKPKRRAVISGGGTDQTDTMSAMRLLIRLLLLFRVGGGGGIALGLVNVPQITRSTALSRRSLGACPPLFDTPKSTVSPSISAAEAPPDQVPELASENSAPTLASPPELDADNASQVGTKGSNNVPSREGIWAPPSQNVAQRRGKVFSIQQPQDLLDFVIEDERLSVGKFTFIGILFLYDIVHFVHGIR